LQGKSRRGPGSVPFGGSNGLVCLFGRREEVLPQRGHDFPHQLPAQTVTAGGCWGHDRHPWPPSRHPQKVPLCRRNVLGCWGADAFGGRHELDCVLLSREVLPQRGHGLRLELRRWLPGHGCVARPGVREHHRSSFAEMPCRAHRRKFSAPVSGDRLCAQIVKEVARVVSR
jgi:hypothetical protein